MQDLPDENTAEDGVEAPGGQRSKEGSGKEREERGVAVRGSEVLCFRHGGRLREAGEDAHQGPILCQETLVDPSQALDLSQSRESLHRGGESCREGPTDGACREGGGLCAPEDSHRKILASAVKYLKPGSMLHKTSRFYHSAI